MKKQTLNVIVPLVLILVFSSALSSLHLYKLKCNDRFISGKSVRPSDTELFVGMWVIPAPGFKNQMQGFRLFKDGRAESVNMSTLIYKRWHLERGQLHLLAVSIGNHTSSLFEEIYNLEAISTNKMVLETNREHLAYQKKELKF